MIFVYLVAAIGGEGKGTDLPSSSNLSSLFQLVIRIWVETMNIYNSFWPPLKKSVGSEVKWL